MSPGTSETVVRFRPPFLRLFLPGLAIAFGGASSAMNLSHGHVFWGIALGLLSAAGVAGVIFLLCRSRVVVGVAGLRIHGAPLRVIRISWDELSAVRPDRHGLLLLMTNRSPILIPIGGTKAAVLDAIERRSPRPITILA